MKSMLSSKNAPLLILTSLSAILNGILFYVEEGRHDFGFLVTGEIFNFLIFFLLISLIPGLIYFLTRQTRYARQSVYLALAGYLPVLLLLLKMS